MKRFGELTGIAFQIKDDLFDYNNAQDSGKPTGLDIKEKKLTLPLIHALTQVTATERRWMVNVVKNRNEDSTAVARVIAKVVEIGGIAHATERMLAYRNEALAVLHTFPETDARHALEGLVHLTVNRTK
jgi:octaprenyl-diphosphate synthase